MTSADTESVVYFSPADERANVLTHGAGFGLSLFCIPLFTIWTRDSELGMRFFCLAFTVAMAAVYLCSTLSHFYLDPDRRNRLRAWDQGTIYVLIIATYSPFIWHATEGWFRGIFLLIVWGAAISGFIAKVIAKHRVNAISTMTYLALGWLPAIPLIQDTPIICFVWMLLGGLAFTLGVPFLLWSQRMRYSHAIWHTMVILGSTCHCVAIYYLLHQGSNSPP